MLDNCKAQACEIRYEWAGFILREFMLIDETNIIFPVEGVKWNKYKAVGAVELYD